MNAPVVTKPDPTTVMIRRSFDADIETLWAALTTPEAIMHWMGGGHAVPKSVDCDLRVGGTYTFDMTGPDGERHCVSGEYLELDPPRRAVFSWAWYTTPDRVSRVTFALAPEGEGRTRLTLTHERLFDEKARDGHTRGWTASLEKLAEFIARKEAA